MGTTQSKKRRKDKQKKRRDSLSSGSADMPRSASMGSLRTSGVTSTSSISSSACPLCPHCRSSLSWSSDHSLTHSYCLHHVRQNQQYHQHHQHHRQRRADVSRQEEEEEEDYWKVNLNRRGRELDPAWEKVATAAVRALESSCQSCPDCFLPSSSCECLRRACEISSSLSQDYNDYYDYDDELSTMSLNRNLAGRHHGGNKYSGIAQSQSSEFAELRGGRKVYNQNHLVKEESDSMGLCDSGTQSAGSFKTATRVYPSSSSTAKKFSQSSYPPMKQSSHLAPPPVSSPSSRSAPLIPRKSKEMKSNSSLLEDEEAVVSRRMKKKQMAQELRKLRIHIQNEEVMKRQALLQTPSPEFVDHFSVNNNVETAEKITAAAVKGASTHQSPVGGITTDYKIPGIEDLTTDSQQEEGNTSTTDDTNTSPLPPSSSSSPPPSTTSSPTRKTSRSKFSRLGNYRVLDNHPVMTRLQNEQNNRLERMERRIEEIRISAMQEAQRRKFAEIFPAKEDDTETQKLLREARESLERMKEEKRKKAVSGGDILDDNVFSHQTCSSSSSSRLDDFNNIMSKELQELELASTGGREDSGEIIPVHVVSSSSREATPVLGSITGRLSGEKKGDHASQSAWPMGEWPDINLGQPLTWLWLPFLLFPLVLRMLVSFIVRSLPASVSSARTGNSAGSTGSGGQADRSGRSLARHRRKKSS